ncbi:hypothetical protein, partial [Limnothrix sp. PR1529]|uniref:hypothetical protein n=1 Tax=Limnothrix sp. PR1529 TaxID=1704291 RepID=UPI00117B5D90
MAIVPRFEKPRRWCDQFPDRECCFSQACPHARSPGTAPQNQPTIAPKLRLAIFPQVPPNAPK